MGFACLAVASGALAQDARERAVVAAPSSLPLPPGKLHAVEAPSSFDERDVPGLVLPDHPNALGCAAPCATGTLGQTHPFYDVYLSCANGAFTARTGASHSVTALTGAPQNVIFGGAGASPGTSDISWRFHDQAITYNSPTGGQACVFDPPDTAMEPNSIGLEQEWTVSPAPGITCTLRQEIVAFGTVESNAGVRLTLSTTNMASSSQDVSVGVRWQIDYQNATDDGPLYANVTCNPPTVQRTWDLEHEMLPAEILDFYRIQNNAGTPIFSNLTSTTTIAGIPDTGRPDRLIYGRWSPLRASPWNYAPIEGACCPDSDSAVLWFAGYLPVDADIIPPGGTARHTVVIFSSVDNVDCGSFTPGCASSITAPPADRAICVGDSTTLDGSGVALTDCTGAVDASWTDGTTTWPGPVATVSPAQDTTYDLAVTCSTDPACRVDLSLTVTVDAPPDFQPPVAADPDRCNGGIWISWNPATFHDASGTGFYNVYRSEVSCADAVLGAPIARGLTGLGFHDDKAEPGRTYFYVVEAEDMNAATTCRPRGPVGGGAATILCATAVTDITETGPPAGVGAVLFASHVGDAVTLNWSGVRALGADEHFHLNKAWLDPTDYFRPINPEGQATTTFTEVDTSAWLQFFDLRVANACETLSLPE